MRLVVIALLLTLTGCGDNDEPKLSPKAVDALNKLAEMGSDWPKCSDIWAVGKRLPKDYEGCTEKDAIVPGIGIVFCDGVEVYTYEPKGHGYFTDQHGIIRDGGENYADDPRYMAIPQTC